MKNKKYVSIPAGSKEGNNIGDFVKTDGGYYKIVSSTKPYYEQTLNTETYVGGVLIKSNGSVQMSNLVLDGRNVKWGYVPAYLPTTVSGIVEDYYPGDYHTVKTFACAPPRAGEKPVYVYGFDGKHGGYYSSYAIRKNHISLSANYKTEWYGCWRS